MNDTSGAMDEASADDAMPFDSVIVLVLEDAGEFDPLGLLSRLVADAPAADLFHGVPSLFPPALLFERLQPIDIEVTPDDKRAVLFHCLDQECRLEPALALPRSAPTPARRAIKRRRMIHRAYRHDREALEEALLCAVPYELIDRLVVDDDNSCRDCMQALSECCELIAFMRFHGINRSSFSDEVMSAEWLCHSDRFRALRNRHWYNKRKACLQHARRRAVG